MYFVQRMLPQHKTFQEVTGYVDRPPMAEPVVSTSSPVLIGGRSAELADAECANRTGELQSASAVEIFAETIGERERKLW